MSIELLGSTALKDGVTASESYSPVYPASKVFDGITTTGTFDRWISPNDTFSSGAATREVWVTFDLLASYALSAMAVMRWDNTYGPPKQCTVYGSTTGLYAGEEVALGVITTGNPTLGSWGSWSDSFNTGLGSYRYYKFIIDSIHCANSRCEWAETKFLYETVTTTLITSLEQPYNLSHDYIYLMSEQYYALAHTLEISLEQLYSAVLEIWNIQYYGDTPFITKNLEMPYSGALVLQKNLEQRWSTPLNLLISLDQPYTIPDLLQIYSHQGYGIAAAVLQKTSEQLYTINQNTTLFATLHQAYAIAGETAATTHFDTKLYINGERLPYVRMQWEASETDYFWSCEAVLHGYELAAKCVEGAEMRIDSAGESYYLKCYDGWMRDKRFGAESYRVKGKSKSWDLSLAQKLSGDIAGGMAAQIVTDLAAPDAITIDWQMDDGYIADGKIVANNESPLDVIRKIVWDTRGKLRPTLAGNLIAAYEEEVTVPDYQIVTPAETIIARIERRSTSSQPDNQPGYNKFIVSDQLAAGDSRNLVKNMLNSHTAEIREFATPLTADLDFTLSHTGTAQVTIEPFGVVSEEIADELVEIKAGSGRTQNPIYGIVKKEYLATNLGNVIFGEDGIIKTEIPEYSLIKITYITKYFRWIGRHPAVADVQFIAEEVQP